MHDDHTNDNTTQHIYMYMINSEIVGKYCSFDNQVESHLEVVYERSNKTDLKGQYNVPDAYLSIVSLNFIKRNLYY
jgi:hypothetical protein